MEVNRLYFRENGQAVERIFNLDNPLDQLRYAAREGYAWPGGYELCVITNDGGLICHNCVKENYREMYHDTKYAWRSGWQVVALTTESNMEDDYCSHCSKELGYHSEEEEEEERNNKYDEEGVR